MPDPKIVQEQEAATRASMAGHRGDPEGAAETIDADSELDRVAPSQPPQPSQEQPDETPKVTIQPRHDPRFDIARRYQEQRRATEQEDEALDPTDAMLPESMRAQPRAQPEPELEAETKPSPKEPPSATRTFKVRGEDRQLNQDQIDEIVRKSLATESYTDEALRTAREASDNAKRLLDETRAARGGADGKPPAGQPTPVEQETPDEPPVDAAEQIARDLQYSTPEEVAPKLREFVRKEAREIASETSARAVSQTSVNEEHVRGQRAISEFGSKYPDLVADRKSRAAIEITIYDIQKADLEAIGVTEETLRNTFKREPTPVDISNVHLDFRTRPETRHRMKSPEKMLDEAVEDFFTWKPSAKARPAEPEREQTQPSPPARVDVRVDNDTRDRRRAAIPQQPSRTPSHRVQLEPERAQPQRRDPSDIVAEMAASRRKLPVNIKPATRNQ